MRREPLLPVLLVALAAASACTSGGAIEPSTSSPGVEPVHVKVAFIEDLTPTEEGLSRTATVFQGAKLAFDGATLAGGPVAVELVGLDTGGDPATAAMLVRQVVSDPSYVGAIEAPFLTADVQAAAGDVLDAGGVATVTLSTLGAGLSHRGWTAWRRAVAPVEREGRTLAAYLRAARHRGRACLAGDGTPASDALLRAVASAMPSGDALRIASSTPAKAGSAVLEAVDRARCGTIVWGGSSTSGALLRRRLAQASPRPGLFAGGETMKDATYITLAGAAGAGTIVACSCVDVSTSTSLAARRFIQDFQSDFGLPPGPFAAEAWDVGHMVLRALGDGSAGRSALLGWTRSPDRFDGLAGTYVFGPDGELTPQAARARLFRDEGGRWIPLP